MKKRFYLTVIVLFVLYLNVHGQNISDNNSLLIKNYFANYGISNLITESSTSGTAPAFDTDVIIHQDGNFNEINIQGNNNNEIEINQFGDDNNFELFSYYNSNASDITTNQVGNNNDIQMFGFNELVNGIIINQTASNQTLIIINR